MSGRRAERAAISTPFACLTPDAHRFEAPTSTVGLIGLLPLCPVCGTVSMPDERWGAGVGR